MDQSCGPGAFAMRRPGEFYLPLLHQYLTSLQGMALLESCNHESCNPVNVGCAPTRYREVVLTATISGNFLKYSSKIKPNSSAQTIAAGSVKLPKRQPA